MKYNQIATLVAVVESGGIRAAARNLGLSQAAVSRTLREMEIETELSLVVRSNSGVTLTSAGQKIYERSSAMVEQMRRLQEEVNGLHGQSTSRLRVNAPSTLCLTVLPHVWSRLRARLPNVELSVDDGVIEQAFYQLRNGKLDLIIGRADDLPLDGRFSVVPLVEAETVILCRKRHPLRNVEDVSSLADVGWVTAADNPRVFWRLEEVFAGSNIRPKVVVNCRTASVALPILCVSDFLSLASSPLAKLSYVAENIVTMPVKKPLPSTVFSLIYRADCVDLPAVRLIQRLLHKDFPEWGLKKVG